MSLKAYEGDVADLGLDFTVVSDELGETKVKIACKVKNYNSDKYPPFVDRRTQT